MALSLNDLRRLYKRCDPDEPLGLHDPRYVDIDHIDDLGSRPRRYAWVKRIASRFELGGDSPQMVLLTGLPGSGKSTELRRILEQLRDPEGAALFPVLIDAEHSIDLNSQIELPELILTLLIETERRIMVDLEGADPKTASDEIAKASVASRLWHWLSTTNVELRKFNVGAHGQTLTIELKTNPSFKEQVRAVVNRQKGNFMAQARKHMAELEARVKRYEITTPTTRYRGMIVVLDSLEKLRGSSSEAEPILASVEHLFRSISAPELGTHLIFTVPAALATRSHLNVEFMPVIKIRDREGLDYGPGLDAMRQLLASRMDEDDRAAVFGADHEQRVRKMIMQTGGYPRELLEMVMEALRSESLPLDDRAFRVMLGSRADGYRRLVRQDALTLLRTIRETKPPLSLAAEDADRQRLSDLLLLNSLVMLYQNDAEWTDVNPALWSMLEPNADG